MTLPSDEDPISPEDLGKLLTEPLSTEDRELVEYGTELLGLQRLPKPGSSFECAMGDCSFEAEDLGVSNPETLLEGMEDEPKPPTPWAVICADYPPTLEDLERWEELLRDHLEKVLSVFLTPQEVVQAIHHVGTEDFGCVMGYLQQVAMDAGKLPFGPYGEQR